MDNPEAQVTPDTRHRTKKKKGGPGDSMS